MTASDVQHPVTWTGPTYNDFLVATVTGTAANILVRQNRGTGKFRLVRDADGMELQSNLADQTTATNRATAIIDAGLV